MQDFDIENPFFDVEKPQLDIENSFFDIEKSQLDIENSFLDIEKRQPLFRIFRQGIRN